MTTTAGVCKAKTKTGRSCSARPMPGGAYCLFHDPLRAAERAKARQNGGKARHGRKVGQPGNTAQVSLRTADDVLRVVEQAVNDTLQMENSLARSRTIAQLATVAVRVIEVTELEQRIAALEQILREQAHERVA